MKKSCLLGALCFLAVITPSHASPIFLGPTPYLSTEDSPFIGQAGSPFEASDLGVSFFLEDFEDGLLNTPGVTATVNSAVTGDIGPRGPSSPFADSVDADDGMIDGFGYAWSFHVDGSGGTDDEFVLFSFDQITLGWLPTHAGIAWTDGWVSSVTTFEAFDEFWNSLGSIGPFALAGSEYSGKIDEDRFFGITYSGGISAIRISNTAIGIEVDHLQYGTLVPTPPAVWLFGSGLLGLIGMARRKS